MCLQMKRHGWMKDPTPSISCLLRIKIGQDPVEIHHIQQWVPLLIPEAQHPLTYILIESYVFFHEIYASRNVLVPARVDGRRQHLFQTFTEKKTVGPGISDG